MQQILDAEQQLGNEVAAGLGAKGLTTTSG